MNMITLDLNQVTEQQAVKEAVKVLSAGGLIIYPTETAYGLGVDATNPKAVSKLMEYKGGRKNKAISIAVSGKEMAEMYVEANETAMHLYDDFLPGPVTVVSKSKGRVVVNLESDLKTLGIRMPDNKLAEKIIKEFGKPITATSANTSGKKTPYSTEDLEKYTSKSKLQMIDLVINVGKLAGAPPSTVVDTTLNQLEVIRQGSIVISTEEEYKSSSPDETEAIGSQIVDKYVENLRSYPLIIALQGDLGSGKTQVVKGMAKELGISEVIVSPTYQIMREYEYDCGKVSGKLVHIDTWRLESSQELIDWDVEKYLEPGNMIVIEWLEKAREIIDEWKENATVVWVKIEGLGDQARSIRYEETGS